MERRSFLQRSIKGIYLAIASLLGVSGIAVWLELRGRKKQTHWFQDAARLSELEIGTPKEVALFDVPPANEKTKRNAAAWLIRREGNKVEAYTARCPHQGGSIKFDGKQFVCRSHGATFDLACQRVSSKEGQRPNPAPRDMDPLEVQMVPDPTSDDMLIQVDYQVFAAGKPGRIFADPNS